MNAQQSESPTLPREPGDDHPSEYGLLKYLTGPLGDEAATCEASGHLSECSHCQNRLAVLRERKATFRVAQPVVHLLDELGGPAPRVRGRVSSWRRRFWIAFPVALAAAALLLVLRVSSPDEPRVFQTETAEGRHSFILKGASVTWVVKRGDTQEVASPLFAFRAGDRIGFRVASPKKAWAVVLSVDVDGEVRFLLPQGNEAAPSISSEEVTVLPLSLLLESPVDTERLFVVLSPGKPSLNDIQRVVEAEFRKSVDAGHGIDEMVSLSVDGLVGTRLLRPEK